MRDLTNFDPIDNITEVDDLRELLRDQNAEIARLRGLVEQAARLVESGGLDAQICCSGHECACRGSPVGALEAYNLRISLEQKP